MRRKLLGFLFFVLFALPAAAQTTLVSGTVVDPNGLPYSGAKLTLQLTAAGATVTVNNAAQCASAGAGSAPCQLPIQGTAGPVTLDPNGSFSVALYSNNLILPGGTQWIFGVNFPGVSPPIGTGPQAFSVSITVSGATQSVSATLSAAAPALSQITGGGGGGTPCTTIALSFQYNNRGAFGCAPLTYNAGTSTATAGGATTWDFSAASLFKVPISSTFVMVGGSGGAITGTNQLTFSNGMLVRCQLTNVVTTCGPSGTSNSSILISTQFLGTGTLGYGAGAQVNFETVAGATSTRIDGFSSHINGAGTTTTGVRFTALDAGGLDIRNSEGFRAENVCNVSTPVSCYAFHVLPQTNSGNAYWVDAGGGISQFDKMQWLSGGSTFLGTLSHSNTANRTYTFPDASGTICITTTCAGLSSVALTAPLVGSPNPITSTGSISCPTCATSAAALTLNQIILGAGSQGLATLGSLGTTTTVLHGNGVGPPSFGAVSMTADITGITPTANGGTGTAGTLVGLVRGGVAYTAAELSGDASTSGSNVVTVTRVNGASIPANAAVLGTNGSSQFAAAVASAIVGLFSGCSGTQYLGADGACHTAGTGTVTASGTLTNNQIMLGAGTTVVKADTGAASDGAGNLTAVSMATSGAHAGYYQCGPGTSDSAPPTLVTANFQLVCPASITAWQMIVPAAAATGVWHVTNAANVGTASISTIATSDIAANAVTSAKMAVVNTRRVCDLIFGDTSGSAITNAQLGPQKRMCFVPAASTIVEMDVAADAGTPNIIVAVNAAGSVSNIVSSALATAAAGAIACSNTGGTTGIDGATTCSATLQNTSAAAGSYIEAVSGTAGGTAKLMTVHVVYTIN